MTAQVTTVFAAVGLAVVLITLVFFVMWSVQTINKLNTIEKHIKDMRRK